MGSLEIGPSRKEKRERSHSHALAIALVEFHRAQCYFISAIEIAAIVLGDKPDIAVGMEEMPPFVDVLLSIPLSMNGFVPVVFTLTFISRYGRLSWYTIILSVLTITLSTGSLAAAAFIHPQNILDYRSLGIMYGDPLCGSNSIWQRNNFANQINFPLV